MAWKFKGNPFEKYSYGDSKTMRNCLEVAAVAIAAERLGIPRGIVNPAGHNYCFDPECADRCTPYNRLPYPCRQKRRWWSQLRRAARKVPLAEVRKLAEFMEAR